MDFIMGCPQPGPIIRERALESWRTETLQGDLPISRLAQGPRRSHLTPSGLLPAQPHDGQQDAPSIQFYNSEDPCTARWSSGSPLCPLPFPLPSPCQGGAANLSMAGGIMFERCWSAPRIQDSRWLGKAEKRSREEGSEPPNPQK